jgi:hypothetical protein
MFSGEGCVRAWTGVSFLVSLGVTHLPFRIRMAQRDASRPSHVSWVMPFSLSLSPVLVPFASAYSHGSMTQPKLPAAFLYLFGFA